MMATVLSEELKVQIKRLNFDRCKIVCLVSFGEKLNHDLRITSQCVWDTDFDSVSSYTWENEHTFCCAVVFGIYHE